MVLEMKGLLQKGLFATFDCWRYGPGDERSLAKLSLQVLIRGGIVLEIKSLSVEALAVITRAI